MKHARRFPLIPLVVLSILALTCLSLAQTPAVPASDIIADFEDGAATGWTDAVNGGTATIAAHKGDTPDGSAFCADVNFSGADTWQYVLVEDLNFGPTFKAYNRNALRLWVKGDPKNGALGNDRIQVQFRETDTGDRWSYLIGVQISSKTDWQQLIVPFSALVAGGSGGNKVFELENITDFRIYSRNNSVPIHLMLDKVEVITQ